MSKKRLEWVSARLAVGTRKRLHEIAERTDRTVSSIVRRAIEAYLSKEHNDGHN